MLDRLPKLDSDQLTALLAASRATAKAHFGVDLVFTAPREIPIEQVFAGIPGSHREFAIKSSFDFKSGKGDTSRLGSTFGKEFSKSMEPLASIENFAGVSGTLPVPIQPWPWSWPVDRLSRLARNRISQRRIAQHSQTDKP